MITTGAKQALSLVAKCLLTPEREAWIEDPSNINVRKIFSYHTQAIFPMSVDYEGIRTELLPPDRDPACIFITPSHQFPLGGVLSIQRRLELIRFVKNTSCYIVEDDYDSEFRYRGLPVSYLQELEPRKVIYIGTFSKTLFPSLRLGYMVLPFPLIEKCIEWKRLGDIYSNSVNQLTLMRFIESGNLEHHISRMKKVYRQRRDLLIKCLQDCFTDQVKIMGETAGMHLVAEFFNITFNQEIMKNLVQKGVAISTVEEHSMNKKGFQNQLILGYAHLNQNQIEKGILRLKAALIDKASFYF